MIDSFYIVSVITNPCRYKRRPELFKEFMARMDKYNAKLYVVEGAFKNRSFEVTDSANPRHIQVRLESELWHKENLMNIGVQHLPNDWKYVAFIDGDIDFVHPRWQEETVHALQHHPVVQMFEDAADLGPRCEVLSTAKSFAYCFQNDLPIRTSEKSQNSYYAYGIKGVAGVYWHPGYAWAFTREAFNTIGGLLETAIIGSGDFHMACSLIGQVNRSIRDELSPGYKQGVLSWARRAERLHRDVGFVPGTIYHFWHGKKLDRRYGDRWKVLIDEQFNPVTDIHKDWQGVWTLYPGHKGLRDGIRDYFRSRNEDSIDKE